MSQEQDIKGRDSTHSDNASSEITVGMTSEEQLNTLAQKYGVNRFRLQLKQDLIILPPICILYLLAFLDRVNIGNAAVYGMSEDLNLPSGSLKYNTALCIFFVPYILFEVPSNYLLKKLRPSIWLPSCMVAFGVCSLCLGFINTYSQLLAIRFLLGLFEAGMFPGCFYLLSCWYRREEAQKRFTFYFSSTSLAGAFGGLIAYGMSTIDGAKGYAAWRWLFIVEGSITVFVAFLMYFCVADFPEDARFLKENERQFVKEKLALDQGSSQTETKVTLASVGRVFKEWKVWAAGFMYFGCIVPAYGYAYFSPTIIKGFGYGAVKTQVYSIFPWIVSFGGGMIIAIFSDWTKKRFYFIFAGILVAIAGFGMLLGLDAVKDTIHSRYAACFLVCFGLYGTMPIIVCWTNMNFSGHHRKMVGSAWQVAFGNIGGIISVFIYRAKDAKKVHQYDLGNAVSVAFACVALVACTLYFFGVLYENRQRRLGKAEAKWEKKTEVEKAEAGDLNPKFVYQL